MPRGKVVSVRETPNATIYNIVCEGYYNNEPVEIVVEKDNKPQDDQDIQK